MKNIFTSLLLLLCTGTVFAQTFPILIPELYPYHDDPTTVFWREEQLCNLTWISRYVINPNGDSALHQYQRSIFTHFSASTQKKTITVYQNGDLLPDISSSHTYDSLGRKVFFLEMRPNPNPPYNPIIYQEIWFYYRDNTALLDSIRTSFPYTLQRRDLFHYDQNDRLITTEHYSRSQTNDLWVKSRFETRVYDANGQLTQIKAYIAQPTEFLWFTYFITYDNANRISTIISTKADTNTDSYKYTYSYNDIDSISTQIRSHWANGVWVWENQKSIDLGYMNRVDESRSNTNFGGETILTMKYNPGETCPFMATDDWLNVNQHYRLYFSYPITGTEEPAEEIPLLVYPNPSNGIIWVESPSNSKLVLRDILGRIVWQGISTGKDQLVLPSGTKGQFLLHVTSDHRTTLRMVLIE